MEEAWGGASEHPLMSPIDVPCSLQSGGGGATSPGHRGDLAKSWGRSLCVVLGSAPHGHLRACCAGAGVTLFPGVCEAEGTTSTPADK